MVISKQAIIRQMKKELDAAMNIEDEEKINQRIASIKALCEVLLQEGDSTTSRPTESTKMTTQELKAMMGEGQNPEKYTVDPTKGDSIFDF